MGTYNSDELNNAKEPKQPENPEQSKPAHQPHPTNIPAHSSNVKCIRCGYDLTGAAIGSDCPECGSPITPSFQSTNLPTSGFAIASLVLGIISIPGCMCYGLPSLVCGILAIIFASTAVTHIKTGQRNSDSQGMATAGRICGIIGITLFLASVALVILGIIFDNL